MPYCITLRSKTEASVTGWYVGSDSRWSTDHKRRKLFDEVRDARPVCHQLRRLCPRNAEFINIEAAWHDLSLEPVPLARVRDPLRRR
jgi:hypothetical protein